MPALGAGAAACADDARLGDEQQAVADSGALAPIIIHQSGEVRRVCWPCAQTVVRMISQVAKPLQQFYARIARRRGKKIAVVALAREPLTTAYGVLKAGQSSDPRKLQPASGVACERRSGQVVSP